MQAPIDQFRHADVPSETGQSELAKHGQLNAVSSDPAGLPVGFEGADALVISRNDLARAVHFWGIKGHGAEPGLRLSREASALVEVLAIMDFERQDKVMLPVLSHPGRLAHEALTTLDGGAGTSASVRPCEAQAQ